MQYALSIAEKKDQIGADLLKVCVAFFKDWDESTHTYLVPQCHISIHNRQTETICLKFLLLDRNG